MVNTFRRTVLALAATLCVSSWSLAQAPAPAAPYPSKPIRIVVGFAPGGSTDVAARLFGKKLSESLGQNVIVENRTGAGGSIAADQVAKSEADGYRLLLLPNGTFIQAVLSKQVPYDVFRDFTPIAFIAVSPMVLVVKPALPAKDVNELIALAQSRPGQLSYGSEGVGAATHLTTERLSQVAGIRMLHVPFKSAPDSALAVATGEIDMNLPSLTSALPLLKAERYRALAVTGFKRSPLLPSVATLEESGIKDFAHGAWFGVVGPANLPRHVVERLHAALSAAGHAPELIDALSKQGMEVQLKSPEEFAAFMREQATQISDVAATANVKIE